MSYFPQSPDHSPPDLLHSFTSTSSQSTASRVARARRKDERERSRKLDEARLAELGFKGDTEREPDDGSLPRKPWPKLRVQDPDNSRDSYSPSIPGSELTNKAKEDGSQAGDEMEMVDDLVIDHGEESYSRPSTPPHPTPRKMSITIAEIPAFRPKPIPAESPATPSVSADSMAPDTAQTAHVTIPTDVMSRIKLKKALASPSPNPLPDPTDYTSAPPVVPKTTIDDDPTLKKGSRRSPPSTLPNSPRSPPRPSPIPVVREDATVTPSYARTASQKYEAAAHSPTLSERKYASSAKPPVSPRPALVTSFSSPPASPTRSPARSIAASHSSRSSKASIHSIAEMARRVQEATGSGMDTVAFDGPRESVSADNLFGSPVPRREREKYAEVENVSLSGRKTEQAILELMRDSSDRGWEDQEGMSELTRERRRLRRERESRIERGIASPEKEMIGKDGSKEGDSSPRKHQEPPIVKTDITGERFEYVPAVLSPVTEKTERSTISTKRSSHYSGAPGSDYPSMASSTRKVFASPQHAIPIHGRRLADGSFQTQPSSQPSPHRPSSLAYSHPAHSSAEPDHSPPASFIASSVKSGEKRAGSPTKRMSPEVSRRSRLFEPPLVDDAKHSPLVESAISIVEEEPQYDREDEERYSIAPTNYSIASNVHIPRSPHALTLWEGYLLCPPPDSDTLRESIARYADWTPRYVVLTQESLEFRPTDSNGQKEAIVALLVKHCESVLDKVDPNPSFRPFGVVMKGNRGVELFGTRTRLERVNCMALKSRVLLGSQVNFTPTFAFELQKLTLNVFRDAIDARAGLEEQSLPGFSATGHPIYPSRYAHQYLITTLAQKLNSLWPRSRRSSLFRTPPQPAGDTQVPTPPPKFIGKGSPSKGHAPSPDSDYPFQFATSRPNPPTYGTPTTSKAPPLDALWSRPTPDSRHSPAKTSVGGNRDSPKGSPIFSKESPAVIGESTASPRDLFGRDPRRQQIKANSPAKSPLDSLKQRSEHPPSVASTLTYVTPPPSDVGVPATSATSRPESFASGASLRSLHEASQILSQDNMQHNPRLTSRQSSPERPTQDPGSPISHRSPRKPSRRGSDRSRRSTKTYVPPALAEDLSVVLAMIMRKSEQILERTEETERQNREMRARLDKVSGKLRRHHDEDDQSDSEAEGENVPNVADKVDYLLHLMKRPDASTAKEIQALRADLQALLANQNNAASTVPLSARQEVASTIFDNDAPSVDTRAAIHDDEETLHWAEDKRRFQMRAVQDHIAAEAVLSGSGASDYSPTRVNRDRNAAVRKLEGLDRSPNRDRTSEFTQAASARESNDDYFNANKPSSSRIQPMPRAPGKVPIIPGIIRPTPIRSPNKSSNTDPFARNVVDSPGSSTRTATNRNAQGSTYPSTEDRFGTDPFLNQLPSRWSADTTEPDIIRQSVPSAGQGKADGRLPQRAEDRQNNSRSNTASDAGSGNSKTGSLSGSTQEALAPLMSQLGQIEGEVARQVAWGEQTAQHQKSVGMFIGEISKYMTEERQRRDEQWMRLLGVVGDLEKNIGSLPETLLANLNAAEAGARAGPPAMPTNDSDNGQVDTPPNPNHEEASAMPLGDGRMPGVPRGSGWGSRKVATFADSAPEVIPDSEPPTDAAQAAVIEPFVQLARKMSGASNASKGGEKGGDKGGSLGKKTAVKGPRMPMTIAGQRIWGAPNPTADRNSRWGGGAAAEKKEADAKTTKEALDADAAAEKPKDGPVASALKDNAELGKALEFLAASGDAGDPGIIAQGVFEILRSLQEIQKQQAEKEAKEKEAKEKKKGLTEQEKAELEAKKLEIQKLEEAAKGTSERQAKLDGLIEQLSKTGVAHEALLAQIVEGIKSPKATQMDPSITEETKKLLGAVQSGVESHVKDFRGQLTSEVQRMFKEVAKLRDEKKELQGSIAELLAFQAKQGGKEAPAKAAPAKPTPAKVDASPSVGFFGPRPPASK
ncbi:hypothetical protein P7C70_g881, partial [Phenoliferia sp. Uapishka_3]